MADPPRNVEYLREHGPALRAEIPDKSALDAGRDKILGVTEFHMKAPGKLGTPKSVYYLFGDHHKADVVRVWLDAHAEYMPAWALHDLMKELRKHGRSWQEAVKDAGVDEEFREQFGSEDRGYTGENED